MTNYETITMHISWKTMHIFSLFVEKKLFTWLPHTKKCVDGKGHLLSCCSVSNIAQRQICCYFHGRKKIRTASFEDTC